MAILSDDSGLGRLKASDAMRQRAKGLEAEAEKWRHLAAILDGIVEPNVNGVSAGQAFFAEGGKAEEFLWELVEFYYKR